MIKRQQRKGEIMIGIFCLIDLEYIPYLKKYTEYFDNIGVNYEIIYWQRESSAPTYKENTLPFIYKLDLSTPKLKKVNGFLKFRKYLISILDENRYDKVVVLSTLTGIIIHKKLINKYKNKMIFDIRDFTYENIPIYKIIEKKLIDATYKTVISSNGFKSFLPNSDKYILCHNIVMSEINENSHFKKNTNGKLELTFIGAVRHFNLDKEVVDCFSKDERYKLVFHGYGASFDLLNEYASNKKVLLTGKYNRNDKEKLLKSTDIINSYYDDKNIVNKYSISNKYYDSVIYKIPLWSNPNTYMGSLAIANGIGLNCKINPNIMYKEYMALDEIKFEDNCNKLLEKIIQDEKKFFDMLYSFVKIG